MPSQTRAVLWIALLASAWAAPANCQTVSVGEKLFGAPKGSCATCHSIDGSGDKLGPDLGAIGDKLSRTDLIRSILEPSATIAVGFGTTTLETLDGKTFAGVVRSANEREIVMMGPEGLAKSFPAASVAKREELSTSLMPQGLQAGYTPEEFEDLVDWLEGLKTAGLGKGLGDGTVDEIPRASTPVTLDPLFPGMEKFDEPTWFGWIPGRGHDAGLVLEHGGRSFIVGDGVRRPFLDLSHRVRRGGATGLLACAFHPDFPRDRRYFLKYQIVEDGVISTLLEERQFAANRIADSGRPGRQLMKIRSVTQDHNGGSLGFGPDGYLYLGMGDTGPQDDPQGHGQNLSILLGKILRIDVNQKDVGSEYAVPADNPFIGRDGARPEIWAYGFREPWRLSWDRETGDLWVGDVGQNRFEEVAIVRKGENHGWNVLEAHRPHSERYRRAGETYVPPVLGYSHRIGQSVTGGYVYRGSKAPKMRGWYVFGDYESRRIWALNQNERKVTKVVEIGRAPTRIISFSEDSAGELYLVGFNDGVIYRMNLDTVDPRPRETRVIAPTAEIQPVQWKYTTQRPATGWRDIDFDDAAWVEAPAGFGADHPPGSQQRTEWRSRDIWLRREFEVTATDVESGGRLILRLHHDEDVEIHLNGEEILRRPRWTTGYIEEELPPSAKLVAGKNLLTVHCQQKTGGQYIDAGLLQVIEPSSDPKP